MKVRIDRGKCQGHNRCVDICPGVFDTDELGYAVSLVEVVPSELEGDTRDAADSCPERAIALNDGGD